MTDAIAAAASLALAVKLKMIFNELFEKDDKYLAFPNLSSLGFSYSYLEFMKDPTKTSLSAQEQLNFMADFSRQMNFIPEDKLIFTPDASRFLWDEVKEILTDSVFAESALTPDEESQLAEAIDYLTDDQIDTYGNRIPVNSPQASKYYEYKTIAEEAERIYLDEKLSVEFAEGTDAQQLKVEWNAYREKQLKEAWDKAEVDWINLGFKRQVEEYIALRNSLELRKYVNLYRQAYLNDLAISEIFDLNGRGIGFYTTFFSPNNVFDTQLPWTSITLTKSEIVSLLKIAPSELKTAFGVDQGKVDIEAISLEYNNVVVIRPWFKPEFFGSRYWKLPDDTIISNGQVPRKGILPSFITSIVVARNVRITRRKEMAQHPVILPLLSKVPVQKLMLSDVPVEKVKLVLPQDTTIAERRLSFDNKPALVMRSQAVPATSKLAARSSFVRSNVAPTGILSSSAVAKNAEPHVLKIQMSYKNVKYEGLTIKAQRNRIVFPKPINDSRQQPQNSQLVTETINLDGVSVLALVCKRLPKSPDPDTSLQW